MSFVDSVHFQIPTNKPISINLYFSRRERILKTNLFEGLASVCKTLPCNWKLDIDGFDTSA